MARARVRVMARDMAGATDRARARVGARAMARIIG